MLAETKREIDANSGEPILIFDDQTGRQVDFDFRGTTDEVLARVETTSAPRTGPGRPKLGVISREVSLLPRHWEWLEQQPTGISAALRRLVDDERKRQPNKERARLAREAASKFMWAIAGNFADFEEASRALFAGEKDKFSEHIANWPSDVREHLQRLLPEFTWTPIPVAVE